MKNKKNKKKQAVSGFSYYRTKAQLMDYMNIPAAEKLRWLDDMWEFNKIVAQSNPEIAAVQEAFRRAEI